MKSLVPTHGRHFSRETPARGTFVKPPGTRNDLKTFHCKFRGWQGASIQMHWQNLWKSVYSAARGVPVEHRRPAREARMAELLSDDEAVYRDFMDEAANAGTQSLPLVTKNAA